MEFKHQKDLGPDAIQKWCEELDRKPKRELTPEEGKTLFMCMINEPHYRTDKNFESLLGKWNGVAILYDRIKENHTYTIENAVLLFLGSVIDRPGIAVQYANFMQYHVVKTIQIIKIYSVFCISHATLKGLLYLIGRNNRPLPVI